MLSDFEIRNMREMGAVVIEPFREEALNPNSYDLTLGPYVARYKWRRDSLRPADTTGADGFVIEDYRAKGEFKIRAGESMLCHTNEFIGGTSIESGDYSPAHGKRMPEAVAINTQMRATSTAGRWGLTACRCAGHGDVGYTNRWTLEVQNNSPHDIMLPVGAIICQLVFFRVSTPDRTYQRASGNYQQVRDINVVMKEWTPEQMLPRPLKRTEFWKGLYA